VSYGIFTWNLALEACTTAWKQRHERVTYLQSSAMLTQWKHSDDLGYLTEVSSVPLQQALRHLQSAYARFWQKQARYLRFKSRKKSRSAAEYTRSAFRYRGGQPHLAKMTAPLAVVWSRPQQTVVGVDAGITSLVALSSGAKIASPRHERRDRARLARAQRRLARTRKGSANRDKARLKVARVHARIAGRRKDFLHQLTTRLVRDSQAVVIEDLSVRNMIRNHHLARAISDAAWREMRGMLEYKCEWYGRDLIVIGRWYPSSKTCSACAHGGELAARRPRVGMRALRYPARPGYQRRDQYQSRRAGGACLRSWQKIRAGAIPGGRPAVKQEPRRVTAGIPALHFTPGRSQGLSLRSGAVRARQQ